MNAKIRFLKETPLRNQLLETVHSEWFQKALLYAQGELYESEDVTTEQMKGVRRFLAILNDLPEDNMRATEFPSSGLHHRIKERSALGKGNE